MLTIDVMDSGASGEWVRESMAGEARHISRALNATAEKAAVDIREDMPRRFILRNRWVEKGIRFDRSTSERLEARVYSIDPYMAKQETGEKYKPDGHVAIPSAARPTEQSLIPRSMLPRALRGKPDVFKFDFSKNSSYKPYPLSGIFQRSRNGKSFKVLYLLKKEKHTKPSWRFSEQVETATHKYFSRQFHNPGS